MCGQVEQKSEKKDSKNELKKQEKSPFIKKYLPKTSADIIGQNAAITQLKEFILNYKKQAKRAAFLYGETGTGKTSSVYAIAKENNLEVIELNASDFRDEESINSILGAAIGQMSLFFRGKIILVDEVDGVSGTKDRGGIPAIVQLISKSTFPIVLTANNPWDNKFSNLRSKTLMIEYHSLNYQSVANILKHICESEKIEYEEDAIIAIARRAGGDARAAINDLQIICELAHKVKKEYVEFLGEREKEETIHNALMKVFKTTNAQVSRPAFEYVNLDNDQIMLWLDENLPKEYKPEDLAKAYYYLSRADQFKRRIQKRQHWGFLSYINDYMTAGVSLSKKEKNSSFVKYAPTTRILKIWQSNVKYGKRKEIAKKIAAKTHTSQKDAVKSCVPYMQMIFKKDKKQAAQLAEYFDFEDEEVAWLSK